METAAARELAILLANREADTSAGRPASDAQQQLRTKNIKQLRRELAAWNSRLR